MSDITTSVNREFLWSLYARLLRTPSLLSEAESLIGAEHFIRPAEDHILVAWQALLAVRRSGDAISYHNLADRARLILASRGMAADQVSCLMSEPTASTTAFVLPQPAGLLYWACHASFEGDNSIGTSREMLRLFLEDRDVRRHLAASMSGAVSRESLSQALSTATTRLGRLASIGANPTSSVLTGNWSKSFLACETTGNRTFDALMDGGYVSGEMYALLGPMGSGKTTTAVEIACAKAQIEAAKVAEGAQPKTIYFVSYEMSRCEVEQLILQRMAQIPKFRQREIVSSNQLSTARDTSTYQPYEQSRFKMAFDVWRGGGDPPPGEAERYAAAAIALRSLKIVNLSGRDDGVAGSALAGEGMVPELRACIERHQEEVGQPGVSMVMTDFVGLACRRHLSTGRLQTVDIRHLVSQYLDQLRTQVVGQTKGTVAWVLSQVNSKAQRSRPTSPISHVDAEEAPAAFGQLMSYCFALSPKDLTTNCVLMNPSKTRRSEPKPPIVWSHRDLTYGELTNVTDEYEIDAHSGVFVKKAGTPRVQSAPPRPGHASMPSVLV